MNNNGNYSIAPIKVNFSINHFFPWGGHHHLLSFSSLTTVEPSQKAQTPLNQRIRVDQVKATQVQADRQIREFVHCELKYCRCLLIVIYNEILVSRSILVLFRGSKIGCK